VDERMTRSLLFQAPNASAALAARRGIEERQQEVAAVTDASSRFARLLRLNFQIVGRLLYVRIEMTTGDAAGHNMVTKAADRLATWITKQFPELEYASISGNYCTDKKVSAVNGILGRGKYVIAELTISDAICREMLKTTPAKLVSLNLRKNLVGTLIAGGVRTANAHVANVLLAFYLATGQDAANIVEGSQAITLVEPVEGGVYFSVTIPNVIVGTVGSGKDVPYVLRNLEELGCTGAAAPGRNSRRLAAICGAAVLCGELSLMAAQTNPGELMRAHETFERRTAE
jgi:hydroxymethylglutaryl-CoA reductase (NADPH)